MDNLEVDKSELLCRLQNSFRRFDTLLSRAKNYDTEDSGLTDEWSVKDLVAHLIAHEQRAIAEIRAAKRGERLVIKHEENDSFNAGAVYACRAMPFVLVREQWWRSFETVVKTVEALDDADFDPQGNVVRLLDDTIDGALANNTYAHYDEHYPQLERWMIEQRDFL